jgi:hypothetical protein
LTSKDQNFYSDTKDSIFQCDQCGKKISAIFLCYNCKVIRILSIYYCRETIQASYHQIDLPISGRIEDSFGLWGVDGKQKPSLRLSSNDLYNGKMTIKGEDAWQPFKSNRCPRIPTYCTTNRFSNSRWLDKLGRILLYTQKRTNGEKPLRSTSLKTKRNPIGCPYQACPTTWAPGYDKKQFNNYEVDRI